MSGSSVPEGEGWQRVDVNEESFIWTKIKNEPFVPIGFVGGLGAIIVAAVSFKSRSEFFTPSRFLLRLRIVAQGAVVTSMVGAAAYAAFTGADTKNYNHEHEQTKTKEH